jgi:hypothetical protein
MIPPVAFEILFPWGVLLDWAVPPSFQGVVELALQVELPLAPELL